jgi:protease PrsW
MAQAPSEDSLPLKPRRALSWLRVIATVLLFYLVGVVLLVITGNPNLFPTVVILGSFMVPAAYVSFFYERRHLSRLSMTATVLSFFYGGVLGVFMASLLEPLLLGHLGPGDAFLIGLIEEFAKIVGVLLIARHQRHDAELDGLILGAAAGMGFAALESTGYSFTAFLQSGGSLSASVGVTLLRAILAPVGHGTWTAILASVLFREGCATRFEINRKVWGAYLLVSILHGLWDLLPSLLAMLSMPGLSTAVAEAFVGGVGLFILWRRWREARQRQLAELAVLQGGAA